MNLRVVFRALLVLCFVSMVIVDARKCKKGNTEDGKCVRNKKNKGRAARSKRKEAPPTWRRGPPKESQLIVREGTDLTLSCSVRGHPKPRFAWKRNDKLLKVKKQDRYRQRKSRLSIKSLVVEDSGPYMCIASNPHGKLTFTFSVRVLENMPLNDIDVVDRPENQTAQVGDSVVFLCRSHDWPAPTVHWARRTGPGNIIQTLEPNNQTATDVLVVHNVTKADSGEYTCYIGNDSVHKKLSATLTVIEEGESLPFEPACFLHIRRQVLVDQVHGCKSAQPVEMHYCMGSCGRSYYVPQMIMSDEPAIGKHVNQTCNCCVGVVDHLRIVELDCPLGKKKRGFYTLLRECRCQGCSVEGNLPSTTTEDPGP